jgi:hypothetical protein
MTLKDLCSNATKHALNELKKDNEEEWIYTTRCLKEWTCSTIWTYTTYIIHRLEAGPNSGIHLVHAQTTSYQNFWQEMGNVQTLTEAEQEWLHLQASALSYPIQRGRTKTFTLYEFR